MVFAFEWKLFKPFIKSVYKIVFGEWRLTKLCKIFVKKIVTLAMSAFFLGRFFQIPPSLGVSAAW
jgi:hypothetical protein